MDPTKIPKEKSPERHTDGRPVNEAGIYVHKDTKAILITSEGKEGVIQADALMSPLWEHAWERTGDVPSRLELLKMRKAQEKKDAALIEIEGSEEADKPAPGTGRNYPEPAVT